MQKMELLLRKEYQKNNYLVETLETDEKIAVIYFSSRGLFDCKDPDEFKSKIAGRNWFEFYKTRINKASKHIFVRDVLCKWYSEGINTEINSPEKLLEFLRGEIKGYKVITVGSSAGGYAALLFGTLLKAEYIFAFSAQFEIAEKYRNNYNAVEMIRNSDIPVFYMFPRYYEDDYAQFNKVKDIKNIHTLMILSPHHGVPIYKSILRKIINSDPERLKKIYVYKNKPIKESIFILKHFGILSFLGRMIGKNFSAKK